MSTYSDPAYEIDGNLDVIRASDVKERIPRIKPWHIESGAEYSFWEFATQAEAEAWLEKNAEPGLSAVEYEDEAEELEALKKLLSDFGNLGDHAFAVSERAMTEYAEEEAASIDGVTMDSVVYDFIDWKGLADSLKQDMTAVTFRGTTYWIRG